VVKRMRRCLQVLLMFIVALGGLGVVMAGLAMADSDVVTTAGPLTRDLEPVIVSGAEVSALGGTPIDELFVYSTAGHGWSQIPFQVDEVTATGDYTTTEDSLLDGNDEIVFMAMDLGVQAPSDDPILASLPISLPWYEIEVTDPTDPAAKGWAYLVRSSTLTSTFAEDYVDYDLGSHRIEGSAYALGLAIPHPYFDYLSLNGGEDILDRTKTRLCFTYKPSFCPIHEDNLPGDPEISDDLVKDGPVRVVVRGGKGLAYHSMVQWTRPISWEKSWDPPHMRFSMDFTEQVIGAAHYSGVVTDGVTVDGDPDTVAEEPASSWIQLSTDDGTLIQAGDIEAMGGTQYNYYEDDSEWDSRDTGDGVRYGDAGLFVKNPSPIFTYTFSLYVLPGSQPNVGSAYDAFFKQPLSARALIPPPDVGLDKTVIGAAFEPGDPITFTLSIANTSAEVASGTVVTDMLPAGVLSPTFDSTLVITPTGGLPAAWSVEPLAPGEGGVITVTGWLSPDLPSDFAMINQATIWDPEDVTPDNNTDMVIVNAYRIYLPLAATS
jgi:uncharacterized repeat protein (TIGR01451 family)